MKYLITGATGFVGAHLLKLVDQPIVTSRNAERAKAKLGQSVANVIQWNPLETELPIDPATDIDCVINLMGESIAEGRWTPAKKKRIRDSRILGTQNLIAGLRKLAKPPTAFVSASAVGIYGSQGATTIDESNTEGTGYLADICRDWETAAQEFEADGVRVAIMRIGIVLGKEGGALAKLIPLFKWGLGGRLGSGNHYIPWIHVADLARMLVWAAEQKITGPVNAVAPNAVTNKVFTQAIAKAVNRPALLPAPKFGVKLIMGEMADLLFFSQRCVPTAALAAGFKFEFDDVFSAVKEIVG